MKKTLYFLLLSISLWLFNSVNASTIWEVSVDFCNSESMTKSLGMVLDSGKEGEICIEFSNYSEDDVNVSYGFVDWVLTADNYKSKACKNEGDKNYFWQYVTQDVDQINIPSMTKVRQKAYVKFPWGFTGMVNGCLTYFISNQSETMNVDSAMFDVLVRKASFIDILVGWEMHRNLKLSQNGQSIKTYYNKSKNILTLEIMFENAGNVNESVIVDWILSNMFWYNLVFSGENIKVSSDDSAFLKIEFKDIPWYKWPFDISLNMTSNPDFDFDSSSLPEEIKKPITIQAKANTFIFPWIFVYILWWLIILIFLIKIMSKHLKFQ